MTTDKNQKRTAVNNDCPLKLIDVFFVNFYAWNRLLARKRWRNMLINS